MGEEQEGEDGEHRQNKTKQIDECVWERNTGGVGYWKIQLFI